MERQFFSLIEYNSSSPQLLCAPIVQQSKIPLWHTISRRILLSCRSIPSVDIPPGTRSNPIWPPRFHPPPPVSPDKNGGLMLKTLKFFSLKPSYTPVWGPGATTLSEPVVGASGDFFPPQGPGYNSNPVPSYSPSVGGPAGYQPVNPSTQKYPAMSLPGLYNTNQQPQH